jgi:hypothetical protein
MDFLYFLLLFLPTSLSDYCEKFPRRENRLTLGVLIPEHRQRTIGASIELALKHVHSNPNMIPDYCIDLLYRDTKVRTLLIVSFNDKF